MEPLVARDGHRLVMTTYEPVARAAPIRFLVAGATGVPQLFYRRFAEHVARAGHEVTTLDFRGIGRSRDRTSLRGFSASFVDWAELDLAAALDHSLARGPTVVVGHSFGGHAFGLLDRANEAVGLYAFGTGAGWHGHMERVEGLRAWFLWNVLGPPLVAARGYLPSRVLGLGEDLPRGVYDQWRAWCSHPNYFFGDRAYDFAPRFAAITRPIVAVNSLDDAWARPVSARAFFAGYTHAPIEWRTVDVASPIGHMGYFRATPGPPLWDDLLVWTRAQPLPAPIGA